MGSAASSTPPTPATRNSRPKSATPARISRSLTFSGLKKRPWSASAALRGSPPVPELQTEKRQPTVRIAGHGVPLETLFAEGIEDSQNFNLKAEIELAQLQQKCHLDDSLRSYIPRQEIEDRVLKSLIECVCSSSPSGCVIHLQGPTGSGKSVIFAAIVKAFLRYSDSHAKDDRLSIFYHFVEGGNRSDKHVGFIASRIVWELGTIGGSNWDIRGERKTQEESLMECRSVLSSLKGKVVLFVDAADAIKSIGDRNRLSFLPENVTGTAPGLIVLLTSSEPLTDLGCQDRVRLISVDGFVPSDRSHFVSRLRRCADSDEELGESQLEHLERMGMGTSPLGLCLAAHAVTLGVEPKYNSSTVSLAESILQAASTSVSSPFLLQAFTVALCVTRSGLQSRELRRLLPVLELLLEEYDDEAMAITSEEVCSVYVDMRGACVDLEDFLRLVKALGPLVQKSKIVLHGSRSLVAYSLSHRSLFDAVLNLYGGEKIKIGRHALAQLFHLPKLAESDGTDTIRGEIDTYFFEEEEAEEEADLDIAGIRLVHESPFQYLMLDDPIRLSRSLCHVHVLRYLWADGSWGGQLETLDFWRRIESDESGGYVKSSKRLLKWLASSEMEARADFIWLAKRVFEIVKAMGRVEEARDALNLMITHSPVLALSDEIWVSHNLALVEETLVGNFPSAIHLFEKCIHILGETQNEVLCDSLFHLGLCCKNIRNWEAALQAFDRCYETRRQVVGAYSEHMQAGRCLAQIAFIKHSLQSEAESWDTQTSVICLLNLAIEIFETKKPFGCVETAECNQLIGSILVARGQVREASPILEKALRLFRLFGGSERITNTSLLMDLGEVSVRLERFDDAIKYYENAIRIGEGHSVALCKIQLGNIRMKQNEHAEAVTLFESALAACLQDASADIHLDTAEVHRNFGTAYLALGMFDDASKHLRKALMLMPSSDAQAAQCREALEVASRGCVALPGEHDLGASSLSTPIPPVTVPVEDQEFAQKQREERKMVLSGAEGSEAHIDLLSDLARLHLQKDRFESALACLNSALAQLRKSDSAPASKLRVITDNINAVYRKQLVATKSPPRTFPADPPPVVSSKREPGEQSLDPDPDPDLLCLLAEECTKKGDMGTALAKYNLALSQLKKKKSEDEEKKTMISSKINSLFSKQLLALNHSARFESRKNISIL